MISPEIKRRAEELAEALAESKEYKAMKEAADSLERHEAAKIMLRDFRTKQEALQQKIMAGETPTEDEVKGVQAAYELVSVNPYVRRVIEAEATFSHVLAEIQHILAEAVGLQSAESDGSDEETEQIEEKPAESPGRSRLWVPGQP